MLLLLVGTIIALSAQLVLVLFVLQSNKHELANRAFGLLSFSLLVWALLSYLYAAFPTVAQNIFTVRLTMFFVVAQNACFVLFTRTLTNKPTRLSKRVVAYIVLTIGTATLSLTPLLFTKLAQGPRGLYPLAGPGILAFIIHAAISLFNGFSNLLRTLSRRASVLRQQVLFILFGSIVLWGIVPITNFAVSIALKTTFFGQFSPLYGFVFSSMIAYAIIKHRLFNIQAAVARAVAYVLTLVSLTALYTISAFVVSSLLLGSHSVRAQTQIVYIVLALVLAISFQYVKKIFDRITNKLFYQDAYDPQELLNNLNRVLVAAVGLNELLAETAGVIESALKTEFCQVVLIAPGAKTPRIVGTAKKSFSSEDLARAHSRITTARSHQQVIVTDYLGGEEETLKHLLTKNDIAVLAQLGDGSQKSEKEMGHIILGPKKSGNPYSNQDVRIIETIANELVIAIQNALQFEEIQQFNITLQQKVEEATRKLRKTNERLKLLDETKDDFISMASHQLRTPLTSVKGYISLVLDEDAGTIKPNQRKLLTQAFISSQRMVYLIADLLNVSRLRTGKFVIESAPVNLADITQDEVDQLVETAESRNLALTYHKPAHFPVLNLDETKTRQVIMNFIDNAIYYTPSGGHIDVTLNETENAVELVVKDDGIGVPKQEQHHLFTKFYRARNAQKARPDGTGLGLFMAQKVIVAQGGATIFRSKEGHGSTFGFTFPKAQLTPANAAP